MVVIYDMVVIYYMVVIYVFLLEEAMYSYCCLRVVYVRGLEL